MFPAVFLERGIGSKLFAEELAPVSAVAERLVAVVVAVKEKTLDLSSVNALAAGEYALESIGNGLELRVDAAFRDVAGQEKRIYLPGAEIFQGAHKWGDGTAPVGKARMRERKLRRTEHVDVADDAKPEKRLAPRRGKCRRADGAAT